MGNITRRNLTPRPPLHVERGRKSLSRNSLFSVMARSDSSAEALAKAEATKQSRFASLAMTDSQTEGNA